MSLSVSRLALVACLAVVPTIAAGTVQTYCSTSPNSVGPGATIHWSGPVTIQEGSIVVDGLPAGASGFVIYGVSPQQTPFGNGYSCFGGAKWILARKSAASDGTLTLDLRSEGEVEDLRWIQYGYLASQPWSFQCLYRDPAAGGAAFNLSDALLVQF